MIIESAFYQLPETWVKADKPPGERDVASGFEKIISERLKAIGIDASTSIDKPYGINKNSESPGPKFNADIHIQIPNTWNGQSLSGKYVIQRETWIEMKFFRPGNKQTNWFINSSVWEKIKKDILKLCLLVKEDPGKHRDKSRYFCSIFYGKPKNIDNNAYITPSFDNRLRRLLSPGTKTSKTSYYIKELSVTMELALDTITCSFGPLPTVDCSNYSYWGYLVRIYGFKLRFKNTDDSKLKEMSLFYNEPEGYLSPDDCINQQEIGTFAIKSMLSSG